MKTVSAPGKVHLIGEHAVVYGKPAIIASVDLRTYVKCEPCDNVEIRIEGKKKEFGVADIRAYAQRIAGMWKASSTDGNFSQIFKEVKEERFNPLKIMAGTAMNELGVKKGALLDIDCQVPMGAGMGSSASLSVAITQAVASANGLKPARERINEIALSIERFMHGNPSGGDNSACCFGGLIWFVKGSPPTIEKLGGRLEGTVLVNSGIPSRSTGELVSMVRAMDSRKRDKIMDELGILTYKMREALSGENGEQMRIINRTQELLAGLGVSTPKIDELCDAVREAGGAAKLCGAGGGGIVMCKHNDRRKLIDIVDGFGYKYWESGLCVDGVRMER